MSSLTERFVHREYATSATNLAVYRLLLCVYLLGVASLDYSWVASFPDPFFRPPIGITYFGFVGFPPALFFFGLTVVIVTATLCWLFGRAPVLAPMVVSCGLLVGNAWAYSVAGKINHDILLVVAPLVLALAARRARRRPPATGWPLALYALTISVAMFTAAWQKVATGWLEPASHAVLAHLLRVVVMSEPTTAARLALAYTPGAVWELLDIATILLEVAFLVALLRRRAFRLVCAAACVFHLGVAVLFRITFLWNLLAYAAFVDWEALLARGSMASRVAEVEAWLRARPARQLAVAAVAFSGLHLTFGSPIAALSTLAFDEPTYVMGVLLTGLGAAAAAAHVFRSASRKWRPLAE